MNDVDILTLGRKISKQLEYLMKPKDVFSNCRNILKEELILDDALIFGWYEGGNCLYTKDRHSLEKNILIDPDSWKFIKDVITKKVGTQVVLRPIDLEINKEEINRHLQLGVEVKHGSYIYCIPLLDNANKYCVGIAIVYRNMKPITSKNFPQKQGIFCSKHFGLERDPSFRGFLEQEVLLINSIAPLLSSSVIRMVEFTKSINEILLDNANNQDMIVKQNESIRLQKALLHCNRILFQNKENKLSKLHILEQISELILPSLNCDGVFILIPENNNFTQLITVKHRNDKNLIAAALIKNELLSASTMHKNRIVVNEEEEVSSILFDAFYNDGIQVIFTQGI